MIDNCTYNTHARPRGVRDRARAARKLQGVARVSNDRRRLSTSNARATPRRDATRRDGATMAPNGAKRRKASSPIAGEGAAKTRARGRRRGERSRGKR